MKTVMSIEMEPSQSNKWMFFFLCPQAERDPANGGQA